ncbi:MULTISPECIES: hypothetical protein [unclassified Nocardioides]|uniref:hypothetical protein n=1 Tax=unclassified Nocardioides TaxID=2615069 RepID=UPI0009F03A36|nr:MULTISPECIES: hypothetical protein [unclassified Nocardioides]GAW47858.1 uncharacterized protein PD653B2_0168 [Nocardioides sp. PD653-B2]GAW53841.1 uncharacterized protein PD653_1245 [Nocardioides sp. PD653]
MTIAFLLMAGLTAFVLLVPTLMVAVLVSGLARREVSPETVDELVTEPVEVPAVA